MKRLLFLGLAIILTAPFKSSADGCFVAPKFVWDKHKDINEPTQKAIIVYDAGREDLILQVKYEGPTAEFGWLIPVPSKPVVKEGSMKCFYELSQYTDRDVTDTEALPLLRNSDPNIRGGLALVILYQNADKQAVEMTFPLLKDPEQLVRMRAAATLRALTGQHFTAEQTTEWENWWAENKTNFVVELHPDELRRQRSRPAADDTIQIPPSSLSPGANSQ